MKKKYHKNKIVCIFQFVNSPYAWNLKSKSGTCLHNFDLFFTVIDEGGSAALQVGSVYSLHGVCDWRSLAIRHLPYQPRCLQNRARVHLSSNVEHALVSCWWIR